MERSTWISMDFWGEIPMDFSGFPLSYLPGLALLPPVSRLIPFFSRFSPFLPAVTDKFTESLYVLANEPSVALFRLQEHVRRSLPELAQHKSDMQSWEEQSQGAIYTVEYACSAIKSMTDSSVYFKSIDSLLKHSIAMKEQLNAAQGRRYPQNPGEQPQHCPGQHSLIFPHSLGETSAAC
ncbi:hypothetical protein EK904_010825 [Melospiza melodia maxima]|nr:hypothetical protein EK904_010825 [Melospiza melodia maxima]